MEFIPAYAPSSGESMLVILASVAGFGGWMGGLYITDVTKGKARLLALPVFAIALAGILYMLMLFLYGAPGSGAPVEARIASFEKTYGLGLTDEERQALEYPPSRPEEDFAVFGSFVRELPTDEGFSRQTVYLIWKDRLMELASSPDGEQFTSLEAR